MFSQLSKDLLSGFTLENLTKHQFIVTICFQELYCLIIDQLDLFSDINNSTLVGQL